MNMRKNYYAVATGNKIGIFSNYHRCLHQTYGYSNSKFKGFIDFEDARDYVYEETGILINEWEVDKEI
ncbi:RNase H1/viroplasmin domain-containing protein [Terrisporobacter hibernicus]|uniref:RNase H1/viroplasmin domain-containing protein n=1 Tax=Terrisporobacter hibernicus TaxID=2813371 RepID=A0AAX2ZJH0_9FIRM|nr:RNase H1/viroplasmin domain-containing protein [Terrisporobacter hibernicus]UEL49176.1 RNase H1/viroplasmin domain-containing protein [Terrisporobacter hibernicus]